MTRLTSRLRFNIPIAAVGLAVEKAVSLVVMVMLAQYYAREYVGAYLLVLSIINLVALVADLGTNRHLLRICATEPDASGSHLGQVLSFKIPTLFFGLLVTALLIHFWQPALLEITLSIALFVIGREIYYAFGAVMLALGNVTGRIVTGLAGPVVLLAGIYTAMRSGLDFEQAMRAHIPAGIVLAVLGWVVARPQFSRLKLTTHIRTLSTLAMTALPLFLLGLLDEALARSGEILLGWLGDLQSVADFGIGFRIVESCRLVVRPVAMVVFPLLIGAAAAKNWESFTGLLQLLTGAAGLAGVITGGALIALASLVMTRVFGEAYSGGVGLLQIFGLTAPLIFILTAQVLLLASMHLERQGAKIMFLALSGYVIVGIATIPHFGAYAAAWSSLIVRGFLCVAFAVLIVRELRHRKQTTDTPTVSADQVAS